MDERREGGRRQAAARGPGSLHRLRDLRGPVPRPRPSRDRRHQPRRDPLEGQPAPPEVRVSPTPLPVMPSLWKYEPAGEGLFHSRTPHAPCGEDQTPPPI